MVIGFTPVSLFYCFMGINLVLNIPEFSFG